MHTARRDTARPHHFYVHLTSMAYLRLQPHDNKQPVAIRPPMIHFLQLFHTRHLFWESSYDVVREEYKRKESVEANQYVCTHSPLATKHQPPHPVRSFTLEVQSFDRIPEVDCCIYRVELHARLLPFSFSSSNQVQTAVNYQYRTNNSWCRYELHRWYAADELVVDELR